jgi:hypothetical protein
MPKKSAIVDGYKYFKSDRKDKKLMVEVDGEWIHFGNPNYQHYFDRTGLLNKKLNHKDNERRKLYLLRATNIKDNSGRYTYKDPHSANYHAVNILW